MKEIIQEMFFLTHYPKASFTNFQLMHPVNTLTDFVPCYMAASKVLLALAETDNNSFVQKVMLDCVC